jgi:hypothetical protein
MPEMTIPNLHKVPVKAWRKFGKRGQRLFNDVFEELLATPWGHPKMPKLKPDHWKTLCWNAAWVAAEQARIECPK